jgi:hypothetical protein
MRSVDRRAVTWSLRLFGAALLAEVAFEAWAGVWDVHAGRLYPWRHLPILPLYPTWALAIEWSVEALAGIALLANAKVSIALRAAAIVTLVAVLERYSNHGALLFLVALFYAMAPPSSETDEQPTLGLLRAQLVIVYGASALNKIAHGFLSGRSLENLLGFSHGVAQALAIATVVAELGLPVLLWWRPRLGLVGVIALHLGFAVFLSGLASFGLAMTALAVLFVPAPPKS